MIPIERVISAGARKHTRDLGRRQAITGTTDTPPPPALCHKGQHRFDLSAVKTYARRETAEPAKLQSLSRETMPILHQNKGLSLEIIERQPSLFYQPVRRRQGHKQLLIEILLRHQSRPFRRQAAERRIDFLREHCRRQVIGRVLVHHDLHRRKLLSKDTPPLRQK